MILIGKTAYQTPYQNLLPPLTEEENETLKNDIAERGIIVPVVIDDQYNIIDGHNRLRIAVEIGLADIPFDIRVGLTEAEKSQLAQDLNLHRRHLDKEKRQALAVRLRQDGLSYRQIADKLGVSEKTTRNDIASTAENSAVDMPSRITGKDGKERPAVMPRPSIIARNPKEVNQAIRTLERVPEPPKTSLTFADVKREAKRVERTERIEAVKVEQLPTGKFHVIVTDPPWEYDSRAYDPTHRAANPYPSMSVEEIKDDQTVTNLAHDDCILWLWTTNAFMKDAYEVAMAWGFEVKTILTWVKDRMGTGDWLRGQTEHCLMCVLGKPVVSLTNQTTVIHGPLREHSRKPDSFYELVNELCPGRKVELFSRQRREGWEVYGNQIDTF